MSKKKGEIFPLRPKGNKKDINREPEMVELKRMIRYGELDSDKTVDHLKSEAETEDP